MNEKARGFTIVELLIVIVVIGILAAISIVAYNTVSAKARDSQRQSDVATLTKALELYYIDNGHYPPGSWAYSDESSWATLVAALEPYATGLSASDPTNERNAGAQSSYIYSYFTNTTGSASTPGYCGVTGVRQMYILTYRLEAGARKTHAAGDCLANILSYSQSWHRSAKH